MPLPILIALGAALLSGVGGAATETLLNKFYADRDRDQEPDDEMVEETDEEDDA